MRSKQELLDSIVDIDRQLERNKEQLKPYFGKNIEINSSEYRLLVVTKLLIRTKIKLRNELLSNYGVFVI